MMNTMQLIEDLVRQFPNLEIDTLEGGVQIKYSKPEEGPELIGTYTLEAVENGQISLDDIRDDCEAFFAGKTQGAGAPQ